MWVIQGFRKKYESKQSGITDCISGSAIADPTSAARKHWKAAE
jgi:hypothetical protein